MYRRSVLCLLLVCVMLLSASCVVAEATERERENYEETTVAETPLQEAETTTESLENSISEEKKALIASFKLFFASQEKETLSEDQLDALIPHHDMLKKISNMAKQGFDTADLLEVTGLPDYYAPDLPYDIVFWELIPASKENKTPAVFLCVTGSDKFGSQNVYLTQNAPKNLVKWDENLSYCQYWIN